MPLKLEKLFAPNILDKVAVANLSKGGQPMSFKAYHVLVPKAAVADPEPLRAEAALLAKDCGLSPRQEWWSWRRDGWVFGFTDHLTAFLFTSYCSQNGIPFRMRE